MDKSQNLEDLMLEAEMESFAFAAEKAKQHNSRLIFAERDGRLIELKPEELDLSKIKLLKND